MAVGLVWFLCLMAYQPLWVIQCQRHPCRTVMVQFNPYLGGKWVHTFPKAISLNVIAWLKFKPAHYNIVVSYVGHYTMATPHKT